MKQYALFEAPTVTFDPKGTILLLLQRTRLGMQRKINLSKLTNLPPEIRDELVSATAKILKCPELQSINSLDSGMDRWISRNSLPSLFKFGAYLFSEQSLQMADAKLVDYRGRRTDLVLPFANRYADIKDRSIQKLGPALSESVSWPDIKTVAQLFSLRWRWLTIGLPESLSALDPEIAAREQARMTEDLRMQQELIVRALARGLKVLVDRMVEKLTPGPDGKKKVFRDSMVENFREFMEAFPRRYVVENADLEKLVNQAASLMEGVAPEDLRDQPSTVTTILYGMKAVAEGLEPLVASDRRITFEDETGDVFVPMEVTSVAS